MHVAGAVAGAGAGGSTCAALQRSWSSGDVYVILARRASSGVRPVPRVRYAGGSPSSGGQLAFAPVAAVWGELVLLAPVDSVSSHLEL